jgi:hypothetical protein
LKPQELIFVTDRTGRQLTGRFVRVSAESLVLVIGGDEREIAISDVGCVEKQGGLSTGTLVMTGILGFTGMASAGASCSPHCAGVVLGVGLSLGGIALAVGGIHDRKNHQAVVYGTRPDSRHALRRREPARSFADLWLRVKTGDTVDVTDPRGLRTQGIFEYASADSIAVRVDGRVRQFAAADVRQITRHVNGGQKWVWRGTLIGAALLGIGPAVTPNPDTHPVAGAFTGALLGAGIGATVPTRSVVYSQTSASTMSVTPIVLPHRKGLAVSLSF